jgi:hypothetical protein
MLVEKCVIMQMAPVDLFQELTRSMASLVLTMSGKHIVINAFDTCVWDPGGDSWRALCHHEDEAEDGLSDCETDQRLLHRLCVPRLQRRRESTRRRH